MTLDPRRRRIEHEPRSTKTIAKLVCVKNPLMSKEEARGFTLRQTNESAARSFDQQRHGSEFQGIKFLDRRYLIATLVKK